MRVLVFDTETTGLPENQYAPITKSSNWPYIIQLSYVLYDSNSKTLEIEGDHIIKIAEDVDLPESSIKIHGITREKSRTEGISITRAMGYFIAAYSTADVIVAHNIKFDKNMVSVECYRNKINFHPAALRHRPFHDTMYMGKQLCNIRMQNRHTGEIFVKPPKLTELYMKLFDVDAKNLHDSFIDVIVCLRCYAVLCEDIRNDIYDDCPRLKELLDEHVN